MIKDGFISTNPPQRVWDEYSQEYVYLILADTDFENGESFEYAVEQSSFAVAKFRGTKRVILQIENINASLLTKDPDSNIPGSVRYPMNIPLANISAVFVEQEEHISLIRELIAITFFSRHSWKTSQPISHNQIAEWYYLDGMSPETIYGKIDIPDIEMIPIETLSDTDEFSNRYMDLLEKVDRNFHFIQCKHLCL